MMIARRWHGEIRKQDGPTYLELMRTVGLPDYRSTEGNLGAWCLHREEGDVIHVEMLSFWTGWDAIERFAGKQIDKAKYYDFDAGFLISMEPTVTHFEIVE